MAANIESFIALTKEKIADLTFKFDHFILNCLVLAQGLIKIT